MSATPRELVKRLSDALEVRYDAIRPLPLFRVQQPRVSILNKIILDELSSSIVQELKCQK